MRKLILLCALALFLAPKLVVAERLLGCDLDSDGTEDFINSRGCRFNDDLQRIVCTKLLVKLSSDEIRQTIAFKDNKARARKGYSDFACITEAGQGTKIFGLNKKNVTEKIRKVRYEPLANNYIGTWLIEKEGTYAYWIFKDDGTFIKKRAGESLGGSTHFTGTYSVNDGEISGDFTNPGVGRGEIEGTISSRGIFLMDFIEYWHTPRKVVACTGVRQ